MQGEWVREYREGKNKTNGRIYRPSFCENKSKSLFSMSENERFGLVFTKTGSINSGTRFFPVEALFKNISFRFTCFVTSVAPVCAAETLNLCIVSGEKSAGSFRPKMRQYF